MKYVRFVNFFEIGILSWYNAHGTSGGSNEALYAQKEKNAEAAYAVQTETAVERQRLRAYRAASCADGVYRAAHLVVLRRKAQGCIL